MTTKRHVIDLDTGVVFPRASIQVLVATGNYQNIHNVPATAIAAMRERWEK